MTSAHVVVWTIYCCSGKRKILNAYVLCNYRPYISDIMTHFRASSVCVLCSLHVGETTHFSSIDEIQDKV